MIIVEEKKRYYWLDWARSIGIFLVVLGHVWIVPDSLKQWIYSFHMPLFFIISGIFYKSKSIYDTVKKDWNRLLIPYIIYSIVLFVIYSLLHLYSGTFSVEFIQRSLIAAVLGMGYQTSWAVPLFDPGWFIIALFFIHLVMSTFRNRNQLLLMAFMIIGIVVVYFLRSYGLRTYLPLDSAILSLPFFMFGYYLKLTLLKDVKTICLLFFAFISLIINVAFNYFNGSVDIDKCLFGRSILAFYFGGISGSIFILFFLKAFFDKQNLIVSHISSGTIFILGFNLFFISLVKIIASKLFLFNQSYTYSLFVSFIVLIICTLFIFLLNKYAPLFLGIKK